MDISENSTIYRGMPGILGCRFQTSCDFFRPKTQKKIYLRFLYVTEKSNNNINRQALWYKAKNNN